jgi:hypothetical protein
MLVLEFLLLGLSEITILHYTRKQILYFLKQVVVKRH